MLYYLPPTSKKVKIPQDFYPRKSSVELWDSIWGQRIKKNCARRDLSTNWCESFYSGISAGFSCSFFPLFEEIVKECKEANNIFSTGWKKATVCDEFKVLRDIIPNNIRDFIPNAKNSYFSMSSIISLIPQKKYS